MQLSMKAGAYVALVPWCVCERGLHVRELGPPFFLKQAAHIRQEQIGAPCLVAYRWAFDFDQIGDLGCAASRCMSVGNVERTLAYPCVNAEGLQRQGLFA